jgi:type II secretory ATPase GspE/PulE/Tfp pilus assembly ATPase PilB-like protein
MEAYQEQVLAFLKGELSDEEKKAFEESLARSTELRAELERSRELLDLMEAASEKATVHRVFEQIRRAIERGASDIHVIPGLHEGTVFLRIDGALQELERIPKEQYLPVIDRWKVMADCSLTERQLPQEGRIAIHSEGQDKDFDLRVMIMPTVLGERVTARVLLKSGEIVELDKLGFSGAQLEVMRRLVGLPNGVVAVAGPPGSGKTTTLYGMLLHLQRPERTRANIMTVEEPVEFVLDGISQTRVNRRTGLTYATALRAVLRSDLDVVMIGDLPDRETAELALQMASTGHLVLAHYTASSALGAIVRLRETVVEPFLVAQTLTGVVSQRLARHICSGCVEEYEPSSTPLKRLGLTPADGPFHRGAGCEACRKSGYRGRIVLCEILVVDPPLSQLIADGAPLETLWQESFGRAGGSLWDDAREKVRQGLTTVEEVVRVLFDYPPLPPSDGAS